MIVALLMGKKVSLGFPGKNLYPVLGRPLMMYPLMAAKEAKSVDKIFVTTDDADIKKNALSCGAQIIDRPPELCTPEALGEDVFVHGYHWIKNHLKKNIELIILLMCNAPTVKSEMIDDGVKIMLADPLIDSAVSVSKYNMWSPLRARRIDKDGLLKPFVPLEAFAGASPLSCDRDSQGDVYFADMGLSIVRPRCLENIKEGLLPQRWMGKRIYPLTQTAGCDVDYQWQIPQVEYWIKQNLKVFSKNES